MKTSIKTKQVFIRLPEVIGTVTHTLQGANGPVLRKDIYKSPRKFISFTDLNGTVRSKEYIQCLFPAKHGSCLQWVRRSKVELKI
jgi:hypothetical protein